MTATERLRALLDERGVEWRSGLPTETIVGEPLDLLYVGLPDGTMRAWIRSYLTPEQAVEATLGRGTCEVECFDDGMDEGLDGGTFSYAPPTWYLFCGHEVYGSERPRYCPTCGKRVVDSCS